MSLFPIQLAVEGQTPVRSRSGRYASYWNAFLFYFCCQIHWNEWCHLPEARQFLHIGIKFSADRLGRIICNFSLRLSYRSMVTNSVLYPENRIVIQKNPPKTTILIQKKKQQNQPLGPESRFADYKKTQIIGVASNTLQAFHSKVVSISVTLEYKM